MEEILEFDDPDTFEFLSGVAGAIASRPWHWIKLWKLKKIIIFKNIVKLMETFLIKLFEKKFQTSVKNLKQTTFKEL